MKNGFKISMILILQIAHFSVQSSEEDLETKLARLNAERRNLMSSIDELRISLEYMQTDAYVRERYNYHYNSAWPRPRVDEARAWSKAKADVPNHISRTHRTVQEHTDRIQDLNEEIRKTEVEIRNAQAEATRLESQARAESDNRERQNLLTQILSLRVGLQETQGELLSLKSNLSDVKSIINNSKNYTQDHIREKIIQLLQSDTLCSAVKGCRRKKNKLTVDEITKALFTETQTESTPARNPETPAVTSHQGDR